MASAKRKAERLAHRKGRPQHITASGEIVDDRVVRRRGLKKKDLAFSTEEEEATEESP